MNEPPLYRKFCFVVVLYFQCQSCERICRIHNTMETFPYFCLRFAATVLFWNYLITVNINNAVRERMAFASQINENVCW